MAVVGEKSFTISHIIENFNQLWEDVVDSGEKEIHFELPWRLSGVWPSSNLESFQIYLECPKSNDSDDWSIETIITSATTGEIGKRVFSKSAPKQLLNSMNVEHVYPLLTADDNFSFEFSIKILKIHGTAMRQIRNFTDESAKKFSDAIVTVADQKFYVNKMFLASHSTYFESLFLGNFNFSNRREYDVEDVDSKDFQNYLELITGESIVSYDSVSGLIRLASLFDSKSVYRRCEEFLLQDTSRTFEIKFGIALKHKMKQLAEKCISEMTCHAHLESQMPKVVKHEDSIWRDIIFQKMLSHSFTLKQ